MKYHLILGSTLGFSAILASTASAEFMYGLTDNNRLTSFDSSAPGTLSPLLTLTGVAAGHTLRSIDYRRSNDTLYALSTLNNALTGSAAIYTVNVNTGVLTQIGSNFSFLTGFPVANMDFNPVTGNINVVAAATGTLNGPGLSYVVNPDTGAVVSTLQTTESFRMLTGLAFTNDVIGAQTTQAYAFDFNLDQFGTFNPSTGVFFPLGSNGITNGVTTFTDSTSQGLAISGLTGNAYFNTAISPSSIDSLYQVNLSSGQMTSLGSFGVNMKNIATVPEPATMAALGLGILALGRRKRK
jgi:uncharacterized membrane protein